MIQAGITHAFIVEFESEEDRDFYVKEDTAHKAVAEQLMAAVGTELVRQIFCLLTLRRALTLPPGYADYGASLGLLTRRILSEKRPRPTLGQSYMEIRWSK